MMSRFAVAFACLMALALDPHADVTRLAAAQNADIAGAWDVTVVSEQGNTTSGKLVLGKDADKIVGTLTAPQGEMPVEATLKDKAVTIWFTLPAREGPLNVTMSGTVDGDTMKGMLDVAGQSSRRQWSATRAAATAAAQSGGDTRLDVTGTWAFAVETGAGSGTPTMTFRQDGEKLTGQYSGRLGEAPLAGTVKGTAIEFTIDFSVQGTAVRIVYRGTADKTSMKGTIKFGELGADTFTAKKT